MKGIPRRVIIQDGQVFDSVKSKTVESVPLVSDLSLLVDSMPGDVHSDMSMGLIKTLTYLVPLAHGTYLNPAAEDIPQAIITAEMAAMKYALQERASFYTVDITINAKNVPSQMTAIMPSEIDEIIKNYYAIDLREVYKPLNDYIINNWYNKSNLKTTKKPALEFPDMARAINVTVTLYWQRQNASG
jgi:hypothetical protein